MTVKNRYGKTTRRDGSPLYEMTESDRDALHALRDRWRDNAMRTDTMSDEDRRIAAESLRGIYRAIGRDEPRKIVFVRSPREMRFVAGIAVGVEYLRAHPDVEARLFGGHVSMDTLTAAIRRAAINFYGVGSAVAEAVDKAVDVAVAVAAAEAVAAAVTEAVDVAVDEAAAEAVAAAVTEAVDVAVAAAVDEAVAVGEAEVVAVAVDEAVDEAVDVDVAVAVAVDEAVTAAVTEAVAAAVDVDVDVAAAVDEAVAAAVDVDVDEAVAVAAAVDEAAADAVDEVVAAAVDEVVAAAVDEAVAVAVDEAVTEAALISYLLQCVNRTHWYSRWYSMGNLRPWRFVRVGFYRNVAKLIAGDYPVFDLDRDYAEHAGPRWLLHDVAIVCDRPDVLKLRDSDGRSHCEDGPVVKWRDGAASYYWHGTRVPRRVIEDPASYTREEILAIKNSEVVRALAEKLGWEAFLGKLGALTISTCAIACNGEDGQSVTLKYELLETQDNFADGQPKWLRMQSPRLQDGNQPYYIEAVDPRLTSAESARTWRTRRRDGHWPSVGECNVRLSLPDWSVRQGDIVFHYISDADANDLLENKPEKLSGPSLVTGATTGHSHTLVGEFELFDLGDGRKLIHRLGESLMVTHDEHLTVRLDADWTIQSVARQYDREHGWVNVED